MNIVFRNHPRLLHQADKVCERTFRHIFLRGLVYRLVIGFYDRSGLRLNLMVFADRFVGFLFNGAFLCHNFSLLSDFLYMNRLMPDIFLDSTLPRHAGWILL